MEIPLRFPEIESRYRRTPVLQWAWCISCWVLTAGCSAPGPAATDNARAQASFDRGLERMAGQDWEAAIREFDACLEAGSIGPDQVGELYLQKAFALAGLGRFAEAESEMKLAEEGADPDLIARFRQKIDQLRRPLEDGFAD